MLCLALILSVYLMNFRLVRISRSYLCSSLPVCLQEWGEAGAEPEAAPPKNKVQELRDQVDGVKRVMTDNMERILARGERLDDLMDKTSELQDGVSMRRKKDQ